MKRNIPTIPILSTGLITEDNIWEIMFVVEIVLIVAGLAGGSDGTAGVGLAMAVFFGGFLLLFWLAGA